MKSCPGLIAIAAARLPEKTALVCQRRKMTFAELEAESASLAHALRGLALPGGLILPVALSRGCDVAVALLAAWKAGLTACVLDMAYPQERLAAIRRQCGADMLLDEAMFKKLLQPGMRDVCGALPVPDAGDPALAVFTSGSTGQPKGVLLPHGSLALAARGNMRLLREDDVMLATASQSFIAVMLDLIAPLAAGATVHIAPDAIRKDAALAAEYIRREGVSAAFLAPQMAAPFLAMADGSLRLLLTGSERVRNIASRRTTVVNTYGASETCGPVLSFTVDRPYDNTPIGKPYPGSGVFLADAQGRPAKPGEVGEICIQGQIAMGYLHQPELTAQRFAPAPEITGNSEKLFRTGDLGRMREDGILEYVQRKDWMLKIRGFRVEPGEIEAVMLGSAPLARAVVTGYEDAAGQTRLYACYTAPAPVKPEALRDAMARRLPDYMLPAFMEQVEALPLNANGKIDRARIAPPDTARLRAEYAAPQTEVERDICEAFAKILDLEQIGLDDDFVRLGGDSISAMRAQAMLAKRGISCAMLLAARTPRAVASALEEAAGAAPLKLAPEREEWPLTFQEEQMAAEQALDPESAAYNINLAFRLNGPLDVERLSRALTAMTRRHRLLRSYYPMRAGVHVHCIAPELPPISLRAEACAESEVPRRSAELNRPFDLAKAPLFRIWLFETGPDSHILHFTFHHIIMDGLSLVPLLETLWAAYLEDPPAREITEARPDYLDFAMRTHEEPCADTAFFQNMFADGVPENEMPARPRRPDTLPCPDAAAACHMPFAPINQAARRLGVTPHALLTAAFGIVLAKYCGSEDVAAGMAMNCRHLPETSAMVGMFVNTVPVRLMPDGRMDLRQYIGKTAAMLEDVRAHAACPFSSLVPLLAPERNTARAPVFDVMLNYLEEPPLPDLGAAGLAFAPFPLPTQALPMDLTLEMRKGKDSLHLDLLYSTELYQPEIVEGMLDHFRTVLERIVSGQNMAVADAGEPGAVSRRQILEEFAGKNTGAADQTVVDAFRAQARLHPARIAAAIGDACLTYAELDALTDNLARNLAARGIGRGQAAGILVGRGLMMPVGALGVLKSGAAYLPLDPSYPSERLEYMLADSGASLLIADENLLDRVPAFQGAVMPSAEVMGLDAIPGNVGDLPPAPRAADLLTLIYTSGTTGKPKGVMLSHANLANFCRWYARHYGLRPEDVVAAYASFGFDAALMDMYPALTHGARMQIIPEETRLDLAGLNAAFEKYGVTLAFMTTQLGRQFVESMPGKSLRALAVGGEALVPVDPPAGYALDNVYGPTECTIYASAFRVKERHERVPLGKPLDNMRLYILDRHGKLAPVGAIGELCVAGPQVAMGYLNRPDLTAEKFTPNPFSLEPGYERIYHTGDMMRWLPDGSLDFMGRTDFQVKIRGFRVELTEIEGRLRQHADVADAAVIAADAPGGGKCTVAYVVLQEGASFNAEDMAAFIEEQLPPYMVPAAMMRVAAIPLNPNGKVDRRKLPAPDFAAAAETEAEDAGAERAENLLSKTIRETVAELLGHAQFGRTTSLLRAGLASLSAIRLAAMLSDRLGIAPAVRDIMAEPTLLGLENAILRSLLAARGEQAAGERPPARPEDGAWPLAPGQMGVYLDCEKRPDTLAYNIPFRLDIPGADASRLAGALQKAMSAHPGPHVRLEIQDGDVRAAPLAAMEDVPVLHMDDAALAAHAAAFARPFDFLKGPLWRAEVIQTPSGAVLLFDAHHIVFDGASLAVLLRALDEIYALGELPMASVEIQRLSAWAWAQHALPESPKWREDKAWLDALFRDFEAPSQIPPDMPPSERAGALAEIIEPLDGPDMERFCRANDLTPASLCLAAAAYAIARWTQGREAWISGITSGREDISLRNTIGMFVRTVPLRISFGEGQSRIDYARSAHKAFNESLRHDCYPYARVCADYGFTPHIMYACELDVAGKMEFAGKAAAFAPLGMPEPKFSLSIHVEERAGRPVFAIQYDSARYTAWLMERFAETVKMALAGIMADPHAPVCKLSLLSPAQADLLARFNDTSAPLPENVLHRKFEAATRRQPARAALIAGAETWDYARLNAESNRLAHGLLAMGAQPEDRIAFALPRTGRIIIAMLGILKAGCAYIPLDPEYPAERIAHVLEDSGARFILADKNTGIAERLAHMPGLADINAVMAGMPADNPDLPVLPDHLAYLIYTSGSTGKPKGVMLRHEGIANYVTDHERNRHVHALAQDAHAMLSVTTVAFDMFLKESMTALCNGLTLVLADDAEARDPVRLAELFARTGADAFNATPSRLLEYSAWPPLLDALKACRVLMAGAEKYPEALLRKLRAGNARLFNTYGPTEITVSCNCKELTGESKVTVGAPILNTREYVVDADDNILPPGITGELLAGGKGVARGYSNLPEQTAARFVSLNGERVYRTGDYARWTENGEIAILGRNDSQVKLRGLRIELGEVENALAALPGISACAAAIRTLNNQEHLCAWYVGGADNPHELRGMLETRLPRYMTPTAWIRLPQMPSLPNGKTDFRSLPDPEPLAAGDYAAPASEMEEKFCAIFAAVLGMERVGATDSFFDLGGSSLAVARVLIEAGRAEIAGLAYADIFAHPTPRQLAELLKARSGGANPHGAAAVNADQPDYADIRALLADNTLVAFRSGASRPLGNVLLAGATGFLGSHILHSLLRQKDGKICCLLRRGRYASASRRLSQILYYYFEDTFDNLRDKRLFALEGDITAAGFMPSVEAGLSFKPDTIINCAANVSHFAADSSISDVNLGGARNLIDLALHFGARLVHISTASVAGFSINGDPPPDTCLDERSLFIGQSLDNQYVRSKFMAEKAILDAAISGLDTKIMRVGNLMARSRDGEFQINLRSNSFIGRLRAWHTAGGFPYSSYLHRTELAPVDSTAMAVLLLAEAPPQCRIFHPFNNHSLFMGDIVEAMREEGMAIPFMEDAEFAKALARAASDPAKAERLVSLMAYGNMADGQSAAPLPAASDYTAQALLRHDWHWPETGGAYLRNFIRGLMGMGFFDM